MLPDLKSKAGFDSLREAGYPFSVFDSARQFKMQAEILDLAIKTVGGLTEQPAVISDVAYLVMDSLFNPPRGVEFFQRFPKEEVAQFCRLAVNSRESSLPLPVACPVCPDYPETGGFSLSGSIGYSADQVLKNLPALVNFFGQRNLILSLEIHVADVEVFNPIILEHSGETIDSFLAKIASTVTDINSAIEGLSAADFVSVTPMSTVFSREGVNYQALHQKKVEAIRNSQLRKVVRVRKALLAERIKERDFDDFDLGEREMFVDGELADYAVFGDLVNGRAVILSADASSAVPAYNFLRSGQNGLLVNPTIYLRKIKQEGGELFL